MQRPGATAPTPTVQEHGPPSSLCEEVDADVPAAVGARLEVLLQDRVADAAALDGVFTADVAGPLARFTLDGGRRMRSQFLWWAMRACGGAEAEAPAALRTAAALELIQSCALVHDDVMDGSPRRRGGPSFHARLAARYPGAAFPGTGAVPFASAAAVLAGDLALTWADDIVAGTDFDDAVRRRVLADWRAMRTEMVAGQYLDLHGQATGSRSVAQAIRTACLKTAQYTVARPLSLGAALAGADARATRDLCAAGRYAGTAFQLRDDIEGVFGDPLVTGKPSGDDIRSGKLTYLVAVARARAESRGDRAALSVLESSLGDVDLTEDRLRRVREALVGTGALAVVEERIGRLVAAGERRLSAAALSPVAAHHLRTLLARVTAPAGSPAHADSAGPAAAVPGGPRASGAQAPAGSTTTAPGAPAPAAAPSAVHPATSAVSATSATSAVSAAAAVSATSDTAAAAAAEASAVSEAVDTTRSAPPSAPAAAPPSAPSAASASPGHTGHMTPRHARPPGGAPGRRRSGTTVDGSRR
ncbi:polyprenyl synthetase family protein [Streptomyces spongiicola]|uniref:polyprenyl synthetase family protein n=1 Tax=Streptomyces spongiicola TaxID=1690221 RepID=UPI0034058D0A